MRVSEDLLGIAEITTGKLPQVFAISTLDITPYGNGLYHLNSIMQPLHLHRRAGCWRCNHHADGRAGLRNQRHPSARPRRDRHVHDRSGEGVHCRRRKLL